MELTPRTRMVLAFLVGVWSLAAQFIFNRIIFFYIANSEYVAASIISIHLAGFWLGTLVARRVRLDILWLIGFTILATLAANIIVWRIGAAVIGLPLTVISAVVCGLILAALSGALVVRLMGDSTEDGRGVVIADSAGSVLGAVLGGFILIPQLGLSIAFASVLALQSLVMVGMLMVLRPGLRSAAALSVPVIAALLVTLQAPRQSGTEMLVVDGLPIERTFAQSQTRVLYSDNSPYGLVSVLQDAEGAKKLLIDNRPLCGTVKGDALKTLSEWVVGDTPMEMMKFNPRPDWRTANVGLGCGVTVAAMLGKLPPSGRLDIVEINPDMPAAQKNFWPDLAHTPEDARASIHIEDGFRFFAERKDQDLYDVVVIDVAWMQNMNATHLFSKEMYEHIARQLHDDGVLAVWSEEGNPFSAVSLIMYRTLREVFPHVVIDTTSGVALFYASKTRGDLVNFLKPEAMQANGWIFEIGMQAPVNRLDNLVMNRHKFTVFGDSTWDRLFDKYAFSDRATSSDGN